MIDVWASAALEEVRKQVCQALSEYENAHGGKESLCSNTFKLPEASTFKRELAELIRHLWMPSLYTLIQLAKKKTSVISIIAGDGNV
jgi:hypothetical protein